MRPSVIFDFATAPFWISLYMRKMLFSLLSVYALTSASTVLWCSCCDSTVMNLLKDISRLCGGVARVLCTNSLDICSLWETRNKRNVLFVEIISYIPHSPRSTWVDTIYLFAWSFFYLCSKYWRLPMLAVGEEWGMEPIKTKRAMCIVYSLYTLILRDSSNYRVACAALS